MKHISAVYLITCKKTNKNYVGSSVRFDLRVKAHLRALENGTHPNKHLQNSWNKYGADCFKFDILEEVPKEKLIEREQHWIDLLNPSFNVVRTALANGRGRVDPKVTREKRGEAKRKYYASL